jgi:hypothetical protein
MQTHSYYLKNDNIALEIAFIGHMDLGHASIYKHTSSVKIFP